MSAAGIGYVAAVALAAVLVVAALGKLSDLRRTAGSFARLGVPRAGAVAVLAPLAELGTAAALLAVTPAGAAAALVLLVGFSAFLVTRVLAGSSEPCNCLRPDGTRPVSWREPLRNLGLMALALVALGADGPTWPTAADIAVVVVPGVAVLLAWRLLAEERRSQRRAMRARRHPLHRETPETLDLEVVAAHDLAWSSHEPPDAPLDRAAWARLLRGATSRRVLGLLAAAVADGAWPATDEQVEEVAEAHRRACATALHIEQEALEVVAVLEGAGVPTRVLKGPAHAHLIYPDPALRFFGDVDLLVRGEDFDAATATLAEIGGRRHFPEPRPGFDRRFTKGAAFTLPSGLEVDLHRTLCPGPYGLTIHVDELFADTQPFALGGHELVALSPEAQLVHASLHAVLGRSEPELVALRDLAQLLADGQVDEQGVRDRLARWRLEAPVARALRLTDERLALGTAAPLLAWAATFRPRRRDRRWLTTYEGAGRNPAAQAVLGLAAVRGPRAKLAYALAVALPIRAEGRRPGRERWRRGTEGVRELVRPAPGGPERVQGANDR